MQTINCGLKLNEYHTGVATGVTPAEALVITAIHSQGVDVGQFPAIVSPVLSGEAVTIESPAVAAEDEQILVSGRVIPATPAIAAKSHPRTDAEELARLKARYTQTLEGDPKKHVVSQLFPGIAPKLPATFEEIGLKAAEAPEVVKVETRGQSTVGAGELAESHPLRGRKAAVATA